MSCYHPLLHCFKSNVQYNVTHQTNLYCTSLYVSWYSRTWRFSGQNYKFQNMGFDARVLHLDFDYLFKGTVSRDFWLLFFFIFHDSVSPKPLIIHLGPFRIFSKIHEDIRSSRIATGVNDTGGKWKKSSIRKIFMISFGHLWVVELAWRKNFFQVHFKLSAVW